ncbi:CitMHS family transporter [Halalkalicoccus sp. NIPERK01]|uniref:CitMHS family transporter n=1 Tax=Halalkalicoccus sp. NIPERK01 TaxID=3053469 RepID=UPI00256E9F30|nr:citrate:proton symporter [Halalkalicoccus sp. NIPERK01]MDL5362069.1 citrate:proton symporter [Halalkalicoccus sp. NIPERK01]
MQVEGITLGIIGYIVIALILIFIIGKLIYVIPTLIIVPVLGALVAGFGPGEIGEFAAEGLGGIVEITAMFAFAVWYFAIMRDYGLFDPLVKRVINTVLGRPAFLTIGTVVLACATHLDGTGATTFLITIPALLPLYLALDVNTKILAALAALGAGTMNLVPWGGVTVRAVASLDEATIANVYNPLIPAQIAGLVTVFAIAYYFSQRIEQEQEISAERRTELVQEAISGDEVTIDAKWYFNFLFTLVIVAALIADITSPAVVFMVGLVVGILVNVRDYDRQRDILEEYSSDVMTYVGILFAAGILLGVLGESGMITEMANILLLLIPEWMGSYIPVLVGLIAAPMSLLFSPDAYYFGVLPVLAETAEAFGIPGVAVARASLIGQMTVGFPISPLTGATYLLIGLADVDLGEHIKFTFLWAWLVSLVMLVVAILTGAIPLI